MYFFTSLKENVTNILPVPVFKLIHFIQRMAALTSFIAHRALISHFAMLGFHILWQQKIENIE